MNFVQPIKNEEKIEQMKQALRKKSYRNYMIFILGITTGLRISDLIKLKVKDVRDKEHICLCEKKTGKRKKVLISPMLKRDLKDYIKDKDDDEYLIKSRQGDNNHLSRTSVYYILRDAASECGIKEVGTHTLRKTFGYRFYQKSKDVAILMYLFNHSSQAVTLRYIGIEQSSLDEVVRKVFN